MFSTAFSMIYLPSPYSSFSQPAHDYSALLSDRWRSVLKTIAAAAAGAESSDKKRASDWRSTIRNWNFRSPSDGTFGRRSSELLSAVHRNFWAPFIGTFGRHLTEISTAIHWNFRPPFIKTFGHHSKELSTAVHRNFWAPFIGTFGGHLTELSVAIRRNFRPPFIGIYAIIYGAVHDRAVTNFPKKPVICTVPEMQI